MTLKDIFDYNPETGILIRKRTNKVVGTKDAYGYLIVGVGRKLLKVHRVGWEIVNGEIPKGMVIDHINRVVDDNRLCNLRLATKGQNAHNSKIRSDSPYKCTGISFSKEKKKYRAYITINGKNTHIGYFTKLEDAKKARKEKEAVVMAS